MLDEEMKRCRKAAYDNRARDVRYGFKDSNPIVSHLPFLANLLAFSLLGGSQAASKPSKLSQKFLTERCCAVSICLFFTEARQKDEEMLAHCETF